jgi:hypothetical protein
MTPIPRMLSVAPRSGCASIPVVAVIRDVVDPAAVTAAGVVEAAIAPEGKDAVDDDRDEDDDFHASRSASAAGGRDQR